MYVVINEFNVTINEFINGSTIAKFDSIDKIISCLKWAIPDHSKITDNEVFERAMGELQGIKIYKLEPVEELSDLAIELSHIKDSPCYKNSQKLLDKI